VFSLKSVLDSDLTTYVSFIARMTMYATMPGFDVEMGGGSGSC
jgi:hypothetical protein